MSTSNSDALLIEAPAGRHFAQLHKDPQVLADAVGIFVETGLLRGEAVILVAPADRIPAYLQRVHATNKPVEIWQASGQLKVLDGHALLSRIMKDPDAMPVWEEFRESIGQTLKSTASRGWRSVRVYGEMVNDLWRAGHTAAAIRLEEYWNELARLYQFCLFCGYHVDCMNETAYSNPLHEIGRTHSDILATGEDTSLWAALNTAGKEILGIPLSQMLIYSGSEGQPGERKLSRGHQAMLWIQRNMPDAMSSVLKRTREIHADKSKGVVPRRLITSIT